MQFLECDISKHFDHFSYSDYCKVSKVFIQTIHSYQTILSLKLLGVILVEKVGVAVQQLHSQLRSKAIFN